MNDSFGDFNATQTATAGATKEASGEGIISLLIKQILDSPEGNFKMFDVNYALVCAVGIVRNIETSSTKITYSLEDHSGRIDAHYWLEEGDAINAPDVMINNYVKIYGSVRSQAGQRVLMVFKLLNVLDPNEICTHVLEALHSRYKAEEYHAKGDSIASSGNNANMSASGFSSSQGNAIVAGLDSKQLAVFQAIKSKVSDEGIHRSELNSKFSHISASEMNNILDFMISEGHIYSSIDADHFLCTL
ncbi:replication protein A 32 kDa subunit [Drosophila sulfurigaster albostrigata]|uniref:Replication protein A 32 kDa subunit n=1 Tax=Drosophila albomicans TaxID=7291 RepID=A0A6P8WHU3_DROAB|nr:replication protein A 32 kDa subunit [Drosophila albomicans]XP_062142996.1 replication protein A 32 kDa subunit [Drosophila sulfurigaster albostrigata]